MMGIDVRGLPANCQGGHAMTPYWKKGLYHTVMEGNLRHTSDMGTWDDALEEAGKWARDQSVRVPEKEVNCTTYLLPVGAGFSAGDGEHVPQNVLEKCHRVKFSVLVEPVRRTRAAASRTDPASGPKPECGFKEIVPK